VPWRVPLLLSSRLGTCIHSFPLRRQKLCHCPSNIHADGNKGLHSITNYLKCICKHLPVFLQIESPAGTDLLHVLLAEALCKTSCLKRQGM
jgi:hypothetical protein